MYISYVRNVCVHGEMLCGVMMHGVWLYNVIHILPVYIVCVYMVRLDIVCSGMTWCTYCVVTQCVLMWWIITRCVCSHVCELHDV